jgi:uncharacterized glyoxalase superfamily protein PhnB
MELFFIAPWMWLYSAEAERIFRELGEGGVVRMPIAETFWARRFGMLIDKFGIPWMVNCEKPVPNHNNP